MKEVRIGIVGMGDRGRTALRLLLPVEGAAVTALCDTREERLEEARRMTGNKTGVECYCGNDAYQRLCASEEVDLVYICSDWDSHAKIALEAMQQGKHVAAEVPAATTMEELRALVATAKKTGRYCTLLENCCYDPQVQEAVAAIRRGDIGEVVHAEGTYYHCLDDRWTDWRLRINRERRGDLYPTHELGPICQALGIGRDDEMQSLMCMDSAALTGPRLYEERRSEAAPDFRNGDHTTTLIRTRRGRTILLRHDVMTQQPYDRSLTFIGTRGRIDLKDTGRPSHDEMTLAMNRKLVERMLRGEAPEISVGDLARWCSVIPLSERSAETGKCVEWEEI